MIHDTLGNGWQVVQNLCAGKRVQILDLLPAVDASDFLAGLLVDQRFEDSADVAHGGVAHVYCSRTIVAVPTECVSVLKGPSSLGG